MLRKAMMKKEDQPIPRGSTQRPNSIEQELLGKEIQDQGKEEYSRRYHLMAENLNSIRQIQAPPLTICVTLHKLHNLFL